MGFLIGVMRISSTCGNYEIGFELLRFFGHVFATCAVFYVLFLCRVLGAGDIKLLAVSVGFLGIRQGAEMIFCGFLLALIVESIRANVWNCGYLGLMGTKIRLAPYLFGGFCLWMAVFRG